MERGETGVTSKVKKQKKMFELDKRPKKEYKSD